VNVAHGSPEAGAARQRPVVAHAPVDGDVRTVEVRVELREVVPQVVVPGSERRGLIVNGHLLTAVDFSHLKRNVALQWNRHIPVTDVPPRLATRVTHRDDDVPGNLALHFDVVLI